jgi:hypothetical protein
MRIAPVAQVVEQLPFKEKVRGSSPLGGTVLTQNPEPEQSTVQGHVPEVVHDSKVKTKN